MMATRRSFMRLTGGGVILAAAAAGSWAMTRDPVSARMPWDHAGQIKRDPRRYALSHALLAPNPHNCQPWLADLGTEDEVILYCDLDRRLPHTDPFDRQITIGLGCFIELAVMAAAEIGHRIAVTLFPDGEAHPRLDGRPIARLHFTASSDVPRDPLFAHVLQRRSHKGAFDETRQISEEMLGTIGRAAQISRIEHTNGRAKVQGLRLLAWEAMEIELNTARTLKENVDLMRIGRREIEAKPDGVALSGPLIEILSLAGLLSREAMLDPTSAVFNEQAAFLRPQFETAMAFMWLVTPRNGRIDQIAAGRDYVRLNLASTGFDIAMQPFSQALQEFDEVQPHYQQLRRMLGIGVGETLQMFVRLGYGPKIKSAPRWPLESRIRV